MYQNSNSPEKLLKIEINGQFALWLSLTDTRKMKKEKGGLEAEKRKSEKRSFTQGEQQFRLGTRLSLY